MTQPPPAGAPGTGYREGPPPPEPSFLDRFFDGLRGMGIHRRRNDKWLGGVCSGLADRLGVDPLITRAGFILLGLLFGFGVTLYLVAWVLLPDTEGEISAERALRDGDAGSVILLVIAGLVLFSGFPWWWGGSWGNGAPWGFLVLAALFGWWLWAYMRGRAPGQRRDGETTEQWRQRMRDHGSQWGQRVGDQAGQWGQRVGDQAGQWGQRVGAQAAQWHHPSGQQADEAAPGRPGGAEQAPGTPMPPPGPQGAPAWAPASGDVAGAARTHRPAPAPIVRRPRRRSVGFLGVVVAVGLGLVAYGGVQWADDYYGIPGNPWSVGIAAALAAVGLFLLVAGLVGRKGGFVSFLAIVGIIAALVASVAPRTMSFNTDAADRVWTPTTLTTDARYELGAGRGVLDLSKLSADRLDNQTVHVSVNAGDLRVVVPRDLTARVESHVGIGQVSVSSPLSGGSDQRVGSGGINANRDVTLGDGPTDLVVVADVGLGSIHVEKE